ncbi:MAG: hypothetical protein PWP16_1230 [Eubacteriaceae bacterium]|jgi:hypothetical protein|nr:hypothetical protein [Eubacteriaceae bacterium]MDK2904680.1 hypothetical protein [Eubacteriaceae bacterium]MDN5307867.1 hypothetical protein [Eubacteriaceae bacterium]
MLQYIRDSPWEPAETLAQTPDPTIPTELYLSYIEALNHIGSHLDTSNDPDLQFEQLIKLFLYGLIGKSEQQ